MSDESVLPAQRPERIWGGLGTGAPCAVCGKAIATDEVEIELQFASAGGAHPASYHVHAPCFARWERNRRNAASNVDSLPGGSNEGIIPDRERKTTEPREPG